MKRTLTIILVLGMILCAFASCGGEETMNSQEQQKVLENNDLGLDPDKEYTDYKGHEYRILTQGSTGGTHWAAYEFYYDETLTGDALNEAVLERDNALEALHNIKVSYVEKSYGDMTNFVRDSILSGADEFDLIAHDLGNSAKLAQESMLINLRDYDDVLDLEGDHWDQRAIEGLDLDGHLYFTTSDLTLTDKQATWVVFFTKSMFEKYPNLIPEGYDSIYDMVNQGDWTIEHMNNMVKAVSKDNGDGEWTNLDTYGHFGEMFSIQALMIGCGAKAVEKDPNGGYKYVLDQNVESLVDSYEKVHEIVTKEEYSMLSDKMLNYVTDIWVDGVGSLMEKNQVLFNLTGMNRCRLFRGLEADFGIIPMPKANAEQAEYNMYMTGTANCVSIPINAPDKVRSCEILESLTKLATNTTYKAYIEQSLKGKYLRDDESEEMLDIIFNSRTYDIGNIFSYNNNSFGSSMIFSQNPNPTAVASSIQKLSKRNQKALERFLEDMQTVFTETARK